MRSCTLVLGHTLRRGVAAAHQRNDGSAAAIKTLHAGEGRITPPRWSAVTSAESAAGDRGTCMATAGEAQWMPDRSREDRTQHHHCTRSGTQEERSSDAT